MQKLLIWLFVAFGIFATPALAETSVTARNGIRYELANEENLRTIVLKPGQYQFVGFVCDTPRKVDWINEAKTCHWQQKVVADNAGVRLEPAGQSTLENQPRTTVTFLLFALVLTGIILAHVTATKRLIGAVVYTPLAEWLIAAALMTFLLCIYSSSYLQITLALATAALLLSFGTLVSKQARYGTYWPYTIWSAIALEGLALFLVI